MFMKKLTILSFVFLLFTDLTFSQGCIAIRNISGFGQYNLTDNAFTTTNWQINVTSRYFKSFRDFAGTVDQKTPKQNESVNRVFSTDVTISRLMQNGWSLQLSLPYTVNSRESSREHGGDNTRRHTTHSAGLGDIRFTIYKWLLSPSVRQKGNIQVGLGVKFATGDYKYQDYFYRNDSTKILSPVNPSIQLGDGGTGLITELNTFYIVNALQTISLYGNFFYLANPRDISGTQFTAGRTPTTVQIRSGNVDLSVPDVYSMRFGAYYNLSQQLSFSGGLRDEGAPVHDLFGQSNGARRAGHITSVEPGIIYKLKKTTLYVYAPVVISRKIKQNVPDKITSELTGVHTIGPGGFNNFSVFAGVQFKL
jgi:hypothetical protein